MNVDSAKNKMNCNSQTDRELISKLFSTGFTVLSIGFPVMAGALVALRNAELSTASAEELRTLVWLLLPAVVICAGQSLLCLSSLTGFFNKPRWAIYMTFLLIVYMMLSIIIWALTSILG